MKFALFPEVLFVVLLLFPPTAYSILSRQVKQ